MGDPPLASCHVAGGSHGIPGVVVILERRRRKGKEEGGKDLGFLVGPLMEDPFLG